MSAGSGIARGLPLIGHLPWFYADTNGFLLRLARTQGDIPSFRLGREEAFLLSHPDHVQQVLVDDASAFRKGHLMQRARQLLGDGLLTSEGELHHHQRRRLQPAFCRPQIAKYGEIVPRLATRLADRWAHGAVLNVSAAMDELAMAIVVQALLGADVEREAAPLAADLRVLARWLPLLAAPMAQRLQRASLPPFRRAGQAVDRINTAVRGYIAQAAPAEGRDLLSLLLRGGTDGVPMEPRLAGDEAMTLFLAGHDTTAAALTWTCYLLATHPNVDRRLQRELDAVLGDRDPLASDCPELAYAGRVLDEALRLYPPVGRIGRRPIGDYRIGGGLVPAGAATFVSPFVTQRDPRWWPDPERFDPDRWTDEARSRRPRYASFPFGVGPRSCIGGHMARMIGILVIATIARRWRMVPLPGAPAPRIRSRSALGHDRFTNLFFVSPIVHISTRATMLHSFREARLRPEYATLYPDLVPGVWVPACTLRDFVLERGLYQRRTGPPTHRRLLLESHFEFRGGASSRPSPWTGPQERSDEAIGPT